MIEDVEPIFQVDGEDFQEICEQLIVNSEQLAMNNEQWIFLIVSEWIFLFEICEWGLFSFFSLCKNVIKDNYSFILLL